MKEKSKKSARRARSNDAPQGEYRIPIPSREEVLSALGAHAAPMPARQLFETLGLPSRKQQDAMRRRLKAMIRDGQIITNRRGDYCLVARLDVVTGRVIGHRDGYGFVIPDQGEEDIYLAPRQMREIIHGDRVAVRIKGKDHRGRSEGSLVEVLERNSSEVVGRYVREGGLGFVIPDNARITHHLAIGPGQSGGARSGEIVVAEILEQPAKDRQPLGRISEVLGDPDAPGMETEVAIRAHDIPFEWPEDALEQAGSLGGRVVSSDKKDREDLRQLALITIDGADAKDFDDAVYCERAGAGWRLLVAIADVSHYVRTETALDDEAGLRATSVYFPRKVVPMLPETLSNGLCSLNPKVDRLCMVCEMHVNEIGEITVSRFFEGLMRSHARLIYEEVADALKGESKTVSRLRNLMPRLKDLEDVYRALLDARRRRGAIEFEIPEVKFSFDRHGRIARADSSLRNDAHRLIEECMIAANVEAGKFLRKHRMPALYRVHGGPQEEKLEELALFLEAYGIRLPRRDRIEPRHYNAIVKQIKGRPDEALIETVLLRSLPRAVYQPANIGHFGLALEEYVHFTSPIRRYPDLMVHRGIHSVLQGGIGGFPYGKGEMERLGNHCSTAERRADEATREAMDWLKCEFMQDKLGETFEAIVTGVADFGLFVQIVDLQIEGLVHVSSLGSDYFHRDIVHRRLTGERSGQSYQLADRIDVRVVRVDLEQRKIDFEPVSTTEGAGRRPEKPTKAGKRRRRK
jgi:ribonuclease R